MAFEALLKNQLYISQPEVKSQPIVDFLRLQFLSREPSVSKIRPTPSFGVTKILMERCASELNQSGKMAFEALLKNQLYFTQDEVKSQPATVYFLRLPFLSREPSVSKIRPTSCYAFTPKTFQEYFAAFYLGHQLLSGDKGKRNCWMNSVLLATGGCGNFSFQW